MVVQAKQKESFFSKLEHQLYLEVVKVKKYRIAMSKLIVSSHRLEIKVGWWSRPNKKNQFFLS